MKTVLMTVLGGLAAPIFSPDIGWRILSLANLLRLLSPPVLAMLFRMSPAPVGEEHPALFAAAATAYFLYAVVSVGNIRRRWPDLAVQTVANVCVDVLVISLLAYASGGVSSGLAALLILSVGAASSVVQQRLALLFAAIAAVGWLVQQGVGLLAERGSNEGLLPVVLVAALIFIVTLAVRPVARILWEGREPVRSSAVDMTTVAERDPAMQLSTAGEELPRRQPIELTAWLKEFVTAFWLAEEIDKRTLRLNAIAHDVEVQRDPARLYQLLWKLCEHAIEHHQHEADDPVEIRVAHSTSGRRPLIEILHRGQNVPVEDVELAHRNGVTLTQESRPGGHTIIRLSFL